MSELLARLLLQTIMYSHSGGFTWILMPDFRSDLGRIWVMNDSRSQQKKEPALRKQRWQRPSPFDSFLGACHSREYAGSCHMAVVMSLLRTLDKRLRSHNG